MESIPLMSAPGSRALIGKGILTDAGGLIKKTLPDAKRVMIVSDDTVFSLYGDALARSLSSAGLTVSRFVFPHGEENKTLATLGKCLNALCEAGLTRSDGIVALGGGVVGDTAGFAAAVYLRGMAYVQMPTTLLAAVDSSVGGKTAVDLDAGKNMAGAFHLPSLVLCDTDTLHTLPTRQIRCGMAEVLKYRILCGKDAVDTREYERMIAECVRVKDRFVLGDFTDHGRRRFLNLGHTLGHAVEKASGYTLTHGEAVAVGLSYIARVSKTLGYADERTVNEVEEMLKENGLPVSFPIKTEELYTLSCRDKKAAGGVLTPIFIKRVGECEGVTMPLAKFRKALSDTFGETAA